MKSTNANFELSYWLDGEEYPGLPSRPDRYRRGHLTMGSDVDRGLAIQRSRGRKQERANLAYFVSSILPVLSGDALRKASLDYGHHTNDFTHAITNGWQKWSKNILGEIAAAWIHETDLEKLKKAAELGAARTL